MHSSLFCLQGHFGKVNLYLYDPQNDGTGEHVAVKELKQGSGNVESWMKEIDILKSLYHQNIVKYKGCCTEVGKSSVLFLMENTPTCSFWLHKQVIPQGFIVFNPPTP